MLHVDSKPVLAEPVGAVEHHRSGYPLSRLAEQLVAAPTAPTYSAAVVVGLVQAVETGLLAVLGFAIYGLYVGGGDEGFYVPVILACVLGANTLLNAVGAHRIAIYRTVIRQMGRVLAVWGAIIVMLAVTAFLLKASDQVSRVWVVTWLVSGALALVGFRLAVRALVRHWTDAGKLRRRGVLLGGGPDAQALIADVRRGDSDIELIGFFDDRLDARSPSTVAGLPKLGRVADLADFARRAKIDLVIISMPVAAERRVLEMLKQLWVLPADIRLSAHLSSLRFRPRAYSYVGAAPVFDVADRPISDWNFVFKRLFDIGVAGTALLLLSPVMVAAAIAIKLDSAGPVLFRQRRFGFNNELIEVFKFRSMRTDMTDANATRLVTKHDPRVTKVGRFIRKTSIDELPQLFNVLRGELSVVGPRPHALQAKAADKLYHEAVDGYFARHRVKPGMTGWAQVNGWRGETDTVEKIMQRVHHDLYYIEHWSILLDAYIVLMTPVSLFSKTESAY